MRIEINRIGRLYIERAGVMAKHFCPHREGSECGDWCPLFGEPEDFKECQLPSKAKCPKGRCDECQYDIPAGQRIRICGDRYLVGTIEDKRVQK